MRKVVTNTTPLLSLLKIGHLALLEQLYQERLVPEAVWAEIEVGRYKAFYTDLRALSWIVVEQVRDPYSFPNLDRGEAAAVQLALDVRADLVLLDERAGRRVALNVGLTTTGTLGVLLRAKQRSLIPSVETPIRNLQAAGVWLHPALIQSVLQLADEGS